MTLFEYINKYGEYSFEEKQINEVDKTIFSFISYINMQKINFNQKKTISEINQIIELKKEKKNIILLYENQYHL